MGEFIAEVILFFSELALDIQEFFFRKKKRKRRALERKEGLPKKRMVSPYQKEAILLVFAFLIIGFVIFRFDGSTKKTKEKIVEIRALLEKEKEVFKKYPKELKIIIRNNPLQMHLSKDAWNNDFKYQQLENGKSYTLFSVGKDGKPSTKDDIK